MSSFSDNHEPSSSQFLPPPSAQVRGSLFGGPSSDAELPPSSLPEPPRRSIFGGFSSQDGAQDEQQQRQQPEKQLDPITEGSDQEEDEFDMILRERPLQAYYGSDGDSFQESSDEEFRKKKKGSRKSRQSEAKGPRSTKAVAPQPTYVLHRGVDLPPGVDRPNRWAEGPPRYRKATYWRVIANEKRVLNSLITTRARDLSAHLYNTFVTRKRPNQEEHDFGDVEDSDDEESKAFRKKWVSWPMNAASVPRADEPVRRRLDGHDTYRRQPDTRPSAELEEWIIATMMKTAKERFLAREWEDDDIDEPKKEESPVPDAMAVDLDDDDDAGSNLLDRHYREPVIQTDDGLTHKQLRPLSRTVISQLDQVLMGLHHALKHRAKDKYSSDESATESDDEEPLSSTKEKARGRDESRGRKRNRDLEQPERSSPDRRASSRLSPETDLEANDTRDHSEVSEDFDQEKNLMERFPLRDWSEVMGIAAIVGLPSDAIKRASKRCADIFEEDMSFRKFREGRIAKTRKVGGGRALYEHDYFESETESDSGPGPRKRRRGLGKKNKKAIAGSGKWDGSKETESVSRHSSTVPEGTIAKKSRSPSAARSSPSVASQPRFGKDPNRDSLYFCPMEGCRRSRDGFNRLWNYKLHLKKMHPSEYEKRYP